MPIFNYATLSKQKFVPLLNVSCNIKTLSYRRGVPGNLNDWRRPYGGNNMLYKYFWSDTANGNSHANAMDPMTDDVLSSCQSPPHSASGTANVSLSGSSKDLNSEDSTANSHKNKSGERKLNLLSGSYYLPHPAKEKTGGEDAHFICADEQAIGVADGVGGWIDAGVDAGIYARELMANSVAAIKQEPKGLIDPSRVLEKAYAHTKAKGSSTACIVALTDQGIHAINLGDSGFLVVRDGSIVFKSPIQQHGFNFTYQLECGRDQDLPSSGQIFTFPVVPGDTVVVGTDGLFDNLYNNEISAVVFEAVRAGLSPHETARKITAFARQRALDKNRQTPFSTSAQEAGYCYYGGKLDDVTVVVSYITASDT